MNRGLIIRTFLLVLVLAGIVGSAQARDPTLADAVEARDDALIHRLLDVGDDTINIDAAQVDGMTALHWAVYHDDTELAGLLVRSGADVNAENRYGVPPLSLAATNGSAELVRLLLDAGADPNRFLAGGETILMIAARSGSLQTPRNTANKLRSCGPRLRDTHR